MSAPFLALKRDLATDLVRVMDAHGLEDGDLAMLLDTDWARVKDLRRERLDRFSLERLLLFHHRLGQRLEVRLTDESRRNRAAGESRSYVVPSRRALNQSRSDVRRAAPGVP